MSNEEVLAHLRAGRPQDAVVLLKTRLERDPADARGWFLLGASYHALNELSSAAAAFSRSIAIDSDNADVHLAYISVLRARQDTDAALVASRRAVAHLPSNAHLRYASGLCWEDAGQSDAALAQYDEAIRLSPDLEDAQFNKALLLSRIGKQAEAAAILASQWKAHPDSSRIVGAHADTLLALNRYVEVLELLARLAPDDAIGRLRRGVALASLRRFEESRAEFVEAKRINKSAVSNHVQRIAPRAVLEHMLSPENIYLSRAWTALGECDWSFWDGFVDEMYKVACDPRTVVEPAVGFMCQHTPLTGAQRHAICRNIAARIERTSTELPARTRPSSGSIKIGLLSAEFREHHKAYEVQCLLELIDRSRFKIIAYSLSPDDGSTIRTRVKSTAHSFVDLHGLDDDQAAQKIRHDNIDILVDLSGHKTGGRFGILARRPAPLQVNYPGFSCSLASQRIDFTIVDRVTGSDDSEWTEARVFLPGTYYLHDYGRDEASPRPLRKEYGLPEDVIVYCAFHKAEKISPDTFELWMQILLAVPRSVLWLRALPKSAIDRLRGQANRHGVDPGRLLFAQFEQRTNPRYLSRHRLGDLMLDALHHNAIESACDALGEGLPVLSLRGSALASRAGESLIRAAGLPELIASNPQEYVQTAVRLATTPTALRSLKERLFANRHSAPLFDTAGRVRALEAAFQGMYDRMMRGEPPASFDVQL